MLRSLALCVLLGISLADAQSLVSLETQPLAIVPGQTTTVTLHVQTAGGPSRMTFESALQPGVETDMRDDGSGLYSISLPAAPVVAAMRADDVYRPFLGYIRPYKGGASPSRYNTFAEVADPAIPRVPVTADAADAQHTDYLVNLLMPAAFPTGASTTIPAQNAIAHRFFQLFPDAFDVLNIIYTPMFFQNRFHYSVRNTVRGIGAPLTDVGAQYGSASRLLGISVFPIPGLFDGADTGVQHEFAHQWINFVNVPPLAAAIPHWPFSTMASGVMGFSIPPTNEGGNFPCLIVPDSSGYRLVSNPSQPVFTDLDLYLMGLLPPEQVADQFILDRQDSSVLSLCTGALYGGVVTRLRLSDLIANPAVGPRVPASSTTPKQFRVATILVSRDALLTRDEMAFYSFFAQRMEAQGEVTIHQGFAKASGKPFAITSRGLGSMIARVAGAASLSVSPPQLQFSYTQGAAPPAAQTISIANSGGGTLSWAASVDAAWVRLSSAAGTAPAQLSITLAPQDLAPGAYSAKITVSSPGIASQTVAVALTVTARPPSVTIAAVAHGASFLSGIASATWITIAGSNLSQTTREWRGGDFVDGNLPTALDGVSVTVNGVRAYVAYVSPTQINVLAPDDASVGSVPVEVRNALGVSNTATADKRAFAPAFFTVDGKNAAAVHLDGTLVAAGAPAHPGEIILLFGSGFGPTAPAAPAGKLVIQPAALTAALTLRVGGVAAEVSFAGVTASGLCQFNVKTPDLADGDAAVVAQIGGATSPAVSIAVKR